MEHWFDKKSKRKGQLTINDEYELLKELGLQISDRNMNCLEMVLKAAFFELKREVTPRNLFIARHLLLTVSSFKEYDCTLIEDYVKKYSRLEKQYNGEDEEDK